MSIYFNCPNCDKKLKIRDELAGKRVKCPGCGKAVPAPASAVPAPPPRPVREWTCAINADSENYLGNLFLLDGDPARSIIAYETAYRVKPNDSAFASNLALAYRMTGRFEEAEAILKVLLQRDPNFLDAREHLEKCQARDTRAFDAIEAARKAFNEKRESTPNDIVHPDWPGVVVLGKPPAQEYFLYREAAVEDMNQPPQGLSITTLNTDDKSLYDIKVEMKFPHGFAKYVRFYRTLHELVELSRREDKAGCREIGQALNQLGGFAFMNAASRCVQNISNDARIFVERIAFDGVGMWHG